MSCSPCEGTVGGPCGTVALFCKDQDLPGLLRDYPDRVGEMLERVSLEKLCDSKRLRAVLESDAPLSLMTGTL